MYYLTKEKKEKIFKEFAGGEKNTGSPEGQIALFTFRIKYLTEHLKENKKDNKTKKSLIDLVGKRRDLLDYLKKTDIARYRTIIQKLEIRK